MTVRKVTKVSVNKSSTEVMKIPLPLTPSQITYERLQPTSNYTTSVANVNRDQVSNVFTSVSSPGYYNKKWVIVKWIPKKYPLVPPQPLRPLRLPHIRPFKAPVFKPLPAFKPAVRILRSKNSKQLLIKQKQKYDRFVAKILLRRLLILQARRKVYDAYVVRQTLKRKAYLQKRQRYTDKFEKRQKRYLALLKLQNEGVVRYRRVKSTEKTNVLNPYNRTLVLDYGCFGQQNEVVLSTTRDRVTKGPGNYIWIKGVYQHDGRPFDSLFSTPGISQAMIDRVNNQALTRLYKKIGDQELHIGNIIAERHQTFSLLKDIMQRVIALKRAPLKYASSYLKDLPKNVSNDFLAFMFGVKPLVSDAFSAVELLNKLNDEQQTDILVFRTGSSANTENKVITPLITVGVKYGEKEVTTVESVKVSYSLRYKIVAGTSQGVQKLGLLNPAEILWEAMPWSFVVDWFLPIGSYINSLSADAGLQFLGGTKTVTTRQTVKGRIIYDPSARIENGSQYYSGLITGQKVVETKIRTVLTSAPSPLFPTFKNPISAYHLAETLALLSQRFRR